jgi:tetratricopeptide (TPR) repeat protein
MFARHPPLVVRPFLYVLAVARQLELVPSSVDVQAAPTARLSSSSGTPALPEAPVRRSSSSGAVSAVSVDLAAVLAEARARLEALEGQTAFEMLNAARDATSAQITTAFRAATQRWRPGSAPNAEIREVYETIHATLTEAEATLNDPQARETYLRDLAAGLGTPRARREHAQRQNMLARAESALKQREFVEAERLARTLLEQQSDDPGVKLLLASAIMEVRPAGPFDEARKLVAGLLEKEPENDRAMVIAAQIFRRMGDERRSVMQYIKALKVNPRNVDAARELRLVVMRRREPVASATASVDADMVAAIKKILKM